MVALDGAATVVGIVVVTDGTVAYQEEELAAPVVAVARIVLQRQKTANFDLCTCRSQRRLPRCTHALDERKAACRCLPARL